MLVLAFDTATPAVTVALHDGGATLASSTVVDARRHGELLAPGIDAVLREACAAPRDLTGIAVGVGPGPYTGLRVGLVTARIFGSVLGLPVHGACTLDVLAHECRLAEPFLVATDARRGEVYWARYDDAHRRETQLAVTKPDDVWAGGAAGEATGGPYGDAVGAAAGDAAGGSADGRLGGGAEASAGGGAEAGAGRHAGKDPGGLPAVGEGALLYPDAFPNARPPTYPSAAVLASLVCERLGSGEGLLPPEPLYLRRPHADAPGPRKQVSTR